MPTLTAQSTPELYDLATRLNAELAAGRAGRTSFGSKGAAFSWVASLPPIVAIATSNATSEGLSFPAITVNASGTPAGKVAPGAAKPSGVSLVSSTVTLNKYAGRGEWQLEQQVGTDGLVFAVYTVLAGQCMRAYDTDVVAALDAATTPVSGASWSAAILAGIAAVAANGGAPDVLVMSPADYAEAIESPGAGYLADPSTATQSLFGLRILISASAPTGTAYVLDGSSVLAVEHAGGPVVILDPFTLADTNVVRLVVDLFAGVVVSSPGGVAAVQKTA